MAGTEGIPREALRSEMAFIDYCLQHQEWFVQWSVRMGIYSRDALDKAIKEMVIPSDQCLPEGF